MSRQDRIIPFSWRIVIRTTITPKDLRDGSFDYCCLSCQKRRLLPIPLQKRLFSVRCSCGAIRRYEYNMRLSPRTKIQAFGKIVHNTTTIKCQIRDISRGGIGLDVFGKPPADLLIGDTITVSYIWNGQRFQDNFVIVMIIERSIGARFLLVGNYSPAQRTIIKSQSIK